MWEEIFIGRITFLTKGLRGGICINLTGNGCWTSVWNYLFLLILRGKKIWVILILACKLKLHFSVAKTSDSFQSSLRPALFHFIHFSPVRFKKMRSLTVICLLAFSCCKGSQYQGYWVILNFLKVISSENFLGNSVLKSALLSNSYSSVSIHDASYDANIWL